MELIHKEENRICMIYLKVYLIGILFGYNVLILWNKGYISKLEESDYEGLPHLIVNFKSKLIYHCGPSMAITLKNNGVKWYDGNEFIERKIC